MEVVSILSETACCLLKGVPVSYKYWQLPCRADQDGVRTFLSDFAPMRNCGDIFMVSAGEQRVSNSVTEPAQSTLSSQMVFQDSPLPQTHTYIGALDTIQLKWIHCKISVRSTEIAKSWARYIVKGCLSLRVTMRVSNQNHPLSPVFRTYTQVTKTQLQNLYIYMYHLKYLLVVYLHF